MALWNDRGASVDFAPGLKTGGSQKYPPILAELQANRSNVILGLRVFQILVCVKAVLCATLEFGPILKL